MKTIALSFALAALLLAGASPVLEAAEARIEGTVVSATLTACDFKPGTCEGSLLLDTKGKDGTVTVKVPKGTAIKRGKEHLFLPGLKGNTVAVTYSEDKATRWRSPSK